MKLISDSGIHDMQNGKPVSQLMYHSITTIYIAVVYAQRLFLLIKINKD